jgi:hypothetical protein
LVIIGIDVVNIDLYAVLEVAVLNCEGGGMVGGKLGGIEYVEVKDGMLIGLEVALCTSEFEIND